MRETVVVPDDEYAPPTVEDLAREDDEDDYDLWGEA
jgi:hypothetical protein